MRVPRLQHLTQRSLRYNTYSFMNENDAFIPVVVLSLEPERNPLVARDGRRSGGFAPSVFRAHPFRLIPSETDDLVLCVDADSGLLVEGGTGERFVDEAGAGLPLDSGGQPSTNEQRLRRPRSGRGDQAVGYHAEDRHWRPQTRRTASDRQGCSQRPACEDLFVRGCPVP